MLLFMMRKLLQVCQVVLDLRRTQLPESWAYSALDSLNAEKPLFWGTDDANLDSLAVHLSFYRLLQSEEGNVNSVLELEALRVPLLEECLCARRTLSDCRCFPGEVAATGVDLVQAGPALEDTACLATDLLLLLACLLLTLALCSGSIPSSHPAIRRLTPYGRTPPDCVASCITRATSCTNILVGGYSL